MRAFGGWNADGTTADGGFTLTELIVVLALTAILGGGLLFGASVWARRAQLGHRDECAQTLFAALQNQLAEYERGGRLEILEKTLRSDPACIYPLDIGKITAPEGAAYGLRPQDQGRGKAAEVAALVISREAYQAYREGQAGPAAAAIYDMLTPYFYDGSILEASVCVELVPAKGQVFAVLYGGGTGDLSYERNLSDRTEAFRLEHGIGWYGVDALP